MNNKAKGLYYTPNEIASFIVRRVLNNHEIKNKKKIDMLEPSCGDGSFIKALLDFSIFQKKKCSLFLVEKSKNELLKTLNLINKQKTKPQKIISYNVDYLDYHFENNNKYDLILGNPPYISKKFLSKKQINLCKKITNSFSIKNLNVQNIWMFFMISAIQKLKEDGIIAFILPAEMLQVNYSNEVRNILESEFELIEIFKFKELVFQNIQQDVIIIVAIKKSKDKGIKIYKIRNKDNLNKVQLAPVSYNKFNGYVKWTNYFLSKSNMNLINEICNRINTVSEYCDSVAGIVTGANNFFIINKNTVSEHNIKKFVSPIIQKSFYVSRCIEITRNEFNKIKNKNSPCYLLNLGKYNFNNLSKEIKKYLDKGKNRLINKRYKCKERKNWYQVPSMWGSEGIFFKRCHSYPKLLLNPNNYLVTDSAYRISMKEEYDIKNFVFSFYNSLTLLLAEITGRSYGGGVLELTPKEFKNLYIPYKNITNKEFSYLDNLFKNGDNIDDILKYTDEILLIKNLGLKQKTVNKIKRIRKRLLNERMKN